MTAYGPAGPSWNDLNEAVRVEFADAEPAYLKVALDGDGTRITRERTAIEYVAAHLDVPVPTVLASVTGSELPFLATAPMSGRSVAARWPDLDHDERVTAFREIGRVLATVNSLAFDHHAEIVGVDRGDLLLDSRPYSQLIVERIEETRERASSDRFDSYFDEVIAVVREQRDQLDSAPAALVHTDPAMPNLFRNEGRVGLIDWELAHVGDPARELHLTQARLIEARDLADEAALIAALRGGYSEVAGQLPDGLADRAPIYDAVRFLGVAGFFDKVVESREESADELAARVGDEIDRRPEALEVR